MEFGLVKVLLDDLVGVWTLEQNLKLIYFEEKETQKDFIVF